MRFMRASVFIIAAAALALRERRGGQRHGARLQSLLPMVLPMVLTTVLLMAAAGGASAAGPAVDGAFARTVAAGGFDELCLPLTAGQRLRYRFRAEAPLDFNIHHHRGREVFYPVRATALREQPLADFTAPAADDYCLMWENRGAHPVRVDGEIARGAGDSRRAAPAPTPRP
jgi:hypothetical protein